MPYLTVEARGQKQEEHRVPSHPHNLDGLITSINGVKQGKRAERVTQWDGRPVIKYTSYFPRFPPEMFPASSSYIRCPSHAPNSHVSTTEQMGDVQWPLFLSILYTVVAYNAVPRRYCGFDRLLFVLKQTTERWNITFTFLMSSVWPFLLCLGMVSFFQCTDVHRYIIVLLLFWQEVCDFLNRSKFTQVTFANMLINYVS